MLGVRSLSLWYAFLWLQGNRIIKILHGPQSASAPWLGLSGTEQEADMQAGCKTQSMWIKLDMFKFINLLII